jgi:formate dehydrogenase beta subunit
VGDDRVTGIETIGVESVFDADGRFSPTFLPGTEAVTAADTVILAVGQAADLDLLGDVAVELNPNGTVRVDPATLRTSHEHIWAGGDVAKGPRNLIDAVADGKRAAAAIHAELGGSTAIADLDAPPEIEVLLRPGFRRLDSGYDAIERVEVPTTQTERRIGFAEVEVGYDDDQARLEALRCLRCFDDIMLEPSLCILCGLCVDVCPTDCITITRADRLGVGSEAQSALVLDEDRCIRCALCVNRCPPGALSMVHAREVVA